MNYIYIPIYNYITIYIHLSHLYILTHSHTLIITHIVISHAMARDGSSGGVIRLVIIDKDGVEKEVVMGDALPYMPMQGV